jgi:hypothetical protein
MAKAWEDTPEGQAALFGWSRSVINSSPELKKIFAQATSDQWTPDRFVAAVRDTKWFKTHSDTYRQAIILQKSDPATYAQRVAQYANQIYSAAVQMGAHDLSTKQLDQMAEQALWFGWSNDQIKQHLGGLVSTYKGGYTGDAATAADRYSQMAAQYGVSVSPAVLNNWVRGTVAGGAAGTGGQTTDAGVKQWLIGQASSRYPSLADRLKSGETLMDIASPYFQSYAQTLEVNPNSISLKDPLIQSALAGKDAEGRPSTKTVWQFEQDLRNDPRYMKTQQAQDKVFAVGHQVLKDFGLMGA